MKIRANLVRGMGSFNFWRATAFSPRLYSSDPMAVDEMSTVNNQ